MQTIRDTSGQNTEAKSLRELVADRVTYHREEKRKAYKAGRYLDAQAHFNAARNWLNVAGRES